MAKFIVPPSIIKLSKKDTINLTQAEYQNIWPMGTLFLHPQSGLYFRFVKLGNSRWDNAYGISTQKGILCTKGFSKDDNCGPRITGPDKNELVKRLLDYLSTNAI